MPVSKSVWQRRRRLGSTGSARCPSRCHRPHKLHTKAHTHTGLRHSCRCALESASCRRQRGQAKGSLSSRRRCNSEHKTSLDFGRTVGVEHAGLKLHHRRLVRVLLHKLDREPERACKPASCSASSSVKPAIIMTTQKLTAVPGSVFRPKDDRVPQHDVVCVWRRIHALRRILLEALEVPHKALRTPYRVSSSLTSKQSRAAHNAIASLYTIVMHPFCAVRGQARASGKLNAREVHAFLAGVDMMPRVWRLQTGNALPVRQHTELVLLKPQAIGRSSSVLRPATLCESARLWKVLTLR